jgi:predicted transcriptional regulator
LAQVLGRDYKNVSHDVALLEELGLIEFKRPRGGGKKVPELSYHRIEFAIVL